MNYEEEIIVLREEVATLKADVINLCGWQKTQNGSLQRLDLKMDGIYKMLLGIAGTAILGFLGTIINILVLLSLKGGK